MWLEGNVSQYQPVEDLLAYAFAMALTAWDGRCQLFMLVICDTSSMVVLSAAQHLLSFLMHNHYLPSTKYGSAGIRNR